MGQIDTVQTTDNILSSKILPNGYKDKIIALLEKSRDGLTIAEISKRVGVTRHTASIILAELRGANLVEIRKIGMAKLHNWRENKQ